MKNLMRLLPWAQRQHAGATVTAPAETAAPSIPDVPESQVTGAPEVHVPEAQAPKVPVLEGQTVAVEPHPHSRRDPRIDASVAQDVLDVGDLLENYEIRLRLAEALAALPDIEVLAPERGEPFDRSCHRWEVTEPTADPGALETIAYVISAGLADRHGRVLRTARVAVFDMKEN
jgi:hypothetical protein